MALLRTYDMRGLFDFILFVFEEEQDDILWEIWLNKEVKEDFKTFKKSRSKSIRKKKIPKVTQEDEQKSIALASRYIKPIDEKKGGGDDV